MIAFGSGNGWQVKHGIQAGQLLGAGMNRLSDERVLDVNCDEHSLIVDLMDGRTISVPLAWYPRLLHAAPEARARCESCGGGYGIHWPDIDEDLSTEGLLRGAPAPRVLMR